MELPLYGTAAMPAMPEARSAAKSVELSSALPPGLRSPWEDELGRMSDITEVGMLRVTVELADSPPACPSTLLQVRPLCHHLFQLIMQHIART